MSVYQPCGYPGRAGQRHQAPRCRTGASSRRGRDPPLPVQHIQAYTCSPPLHPQAHATPRRLPSPRTTNAPTRTHREASAPRHISRPSPSLPQISFYPCSVIRVSLTRPTRPVPCPLHITILPAKILPNKTRSHSGITADNIRYKNSGMPWFPPSACRYCYRFGVSP